MNHTRLDAAVKAFRQGDIDAFNTIYECTERAFHYVAFGIIKDEFLAQDIVQEAYLTISQTIDTLRADEAFLNWARTIVANKAINACRKQKDIACTEEELICCEDQMPKGEFEEFLPESVLMNQAKQQEILDIVKSLPTPQRSTIYMHYFQELKVQEIADIKSCSPNTIKSQLSQGRKKIQRAVEAEAHKGNKLYSLTGAPILGILLRKEMESMCLSGPSAEAIRAYIMQHTDCSDCVTQTGETLVESLGNGAVETGVACAETTTLGAKATAGSVAAKTAVGMTLMQKAGVGLLTAALIGGGAVGLHTLNQGKPVNWSDPAMEQMVRIALAQPEGDILTNDLEGITELMILGGTHAKTNKNPDAFQLDRVIGYDSYIIDGVEYTEDGTITSLDDLAMFPDLTSVTICYNKVTDISGLAELEDLTHVDLYDNDVQDLAPLKKLDDLVFVAVGANEIKDLTPLAGLTDLEQLYIFVNQVEDVGPLENLTKLWEVGASSNQIKDVSPLKNLTALTYLDLRGNPVEDWSPLQELDEGVLHGPS